MSTEAQAPCLHTGTAGRSDADNPIVGTRMPLNARASEGSMRARLREDSTPNLGIGRVGRVGGVLVVAVYVKTPKLRNDRDPPRQLKLSNGGRVSRARCRFMGLVIVTCFPKK